MEEWDFDEPDVPFIILDESTGEKIVNGLLRLCKEPGCYSDSQTKGYCGLHYDQHFKKGYRNLNTDEKICNNADGKYGYHCCEGNPHQQVLLESNHIRPKEIGGADENENSEWLCMQGHKIISQIQQATKLVIEKELLRGATNEQKIELITLRVEKTLSRTGVSYSNGGRTALTRLISRFYGWYSESYSG